MKGNLKEILIDVSCVVRHDVFQKLEWQLIDIALHAYGKVGVSLYDTLGKDAVGMVQSLLAC